MKEIINDIKDICENRMEGYCINTNKKDIKILIDNSQQCCEEWGYLHTEDDIKKIIGSELYEYKIGTCTQKMEEKLEDELNSYERENARYEFLTILTSNGEVTFCVYNSHNGFYSHGICIKDNDKIVYNDYL